MTTLLNISDDTQLTMSSREIAELTGKEHKNVIRDIRAMLDELATAAAEFSGTPQVDGSSLSHVREEKDIRGYTAMFHLDRELTDTLLTGYSAALRRKVIARWHELETAQMKLPTHVEALRLYADQLEITARQQAELAAAAPAVAFVDRYVESTGNKGFRQVCKLLGANESNFREFLLDKKIMYRLNGEWAPHAQHLDSGRFVVKAGTSEVTGHAYNRTLFTPKGVNWVAGEWAKYQLEVAVAA